MSEREPKRNETELKEKIDSLFKEADKHMDALEMGNNETTWNSLRKTNREGINLLGRDKYRELFDNRYGRDASRHFIKENESDSE